MAQDERGSDLRAGVEGRDSFPSAVKEVGRFVIDPKSVILEIWEALFAKSLWTDTKKQKWLGLAIGIAACTLVLAILRFSGFDMLYFIPTQMRLPMLENVPFLKSASWISSSYVNSDVANAVRRAGIKYIDYRDFSDLEDQRLKDLIAGATRIDFLAYNAESLTSSGKFDDAFRTFFAKPDAHMYVLMSDATSVFYDENATMMHDYRVAKPGKLYMNEVPKNTSQLFELAGENEKKIYFRAFNTQMRVPLIILDDAYCIATVRLPPDGAGKSIRLEISKEATGDSFVADCVTHSSGFGISAPLFR